MRLRSAACVLAVLTAAVAPGFGQGTGSTTQPGPMASPTPAPAPASPSQPPLPGPTLQGTTPVGQAVLFDYRAIVERLQENPDNPALLNELGNFLLQNGRLHPAIAQYRKAVTLQPNLAVVWNNLGIAYTAAGQFGESENAYRRALRLRPEYASAWYNLGALYDQQNRYDDAIVNYQRAIELDPGLLDVRINPRIVSNRHVAAILVKSYLERGGSVLLPVQSLYPAKPRRAPSPK